MKPSGARSKGTGFELTVAKQFAKDLGGFNQQRYLPRAPESGARVQWKGDIVATDKLAAIWPFLIECKKQEGWTLEGLFKRDSKHIAKEWFAKAVEQAKESYDKIPILVFARNYQPWLVAFPITLESEMNYSTCTFLSFPVESTNTIACVLTYQDFLDLYLRPAFQEKIREWGICK